MCPDVINYGKIAGLTRQKSENQMRINENCASTSEILDEKSAGSCD